MVIMGVVDVAIGVKTSDSESGPKTGAGLNTCMV